MDRTLFVFCLNFLGSCSIKAALKTKAGDSSIEYGSYLKSIPSFVRVSQANFSRLFLTPVAFLGFMTHHLNKV